MTAHNQKTKITFRQQSPNCVIWGVVTSPMPLMIGVTDHGAICRLQFAEGRKTPAILKEWQDIWPQTKFVHDQKKIMSLSGKLAGRGGEMPLLMVGTPFQQAVWKQLTKIPAGTTVSYAELARRIGQPNAARAIGSACGKNPLPLFVPCHRVVASDGSLGGFSGGLAIKKALLADEGAYQTQFAN